MEAFKKKIIAVLGERERYVCEGLSIRQSAQDEEGKKYSEMGTWVNESGIIGRMSTEWQVIRQLGA